MAKIYRTQIACNHNGENSEIFNRMIRDIYAEEQLRLFSETKLKTDFMNGKRYEEILVTESKVEGGRIFQYRCRVDGGCDCFMVVEGPQEEEIMWNLKKRLEEWKNAKIIEAKPSMPIIIEPVHV